MNTGPLNENELEWLDDTLAKYAAEGAILDVSELDGLLTAILSAPTDIEPAQWLLAIWGGADNVPRWANDRERDRFVNLTLQHMSDIAERLESYPDQFEPLFGTREAEGQELTIVEEWCFGYLRGVPLSDWSTLPAELQPELEAIREVVASPHVELAVHLFADLALATSFLGVSLGLFDYLADMFQRKNSVGGRLQSGIITFLPPLAFALFYPRGFVMALGYAGVALAVLALIMPALLVMKSRREHPQATWRVAGGAPTLWLVLLCGIGIVAIQFSIAAGLLPAVG